LARKIKIKQRRKDLLKGEDEFLTFSEKAVEWGTENWPLLLVALGVVVLFFVVGLFIKSSVAESRMKAANQLNEAVSEYNNAIIRQVMAARTPEMPFDAGSAYENALYKLNKFIKDHPGSEQEELVRLYLASADIHYQMTRVMPDYSQARKHLEKLAQSEKVGELRNLARHNIGMTYYLEGNYDKALGIFDELVNDGTPVARAANLVYAGRCHEKKGDYDSAIERYRLALDSYSDVSITNGLDTKIAELKIKLEEDGEKTPGKDPEKRGK